MGACFSDIHYNETSDYIVLILNKFKSEKISSSNDNVLMKLNGCLYTDKPLLCSPVTKTECIYYKLILEEECSYQETVKYDNGKVLTLTSYKWVTVFKVEKSCEIYLKDNNDIMFINGNNNNCDNFKVTATISDVKTSVGYNDFPSNVTSLFARYAGRSLNTGRYRYFEYIIKPEEKVSVMGVVSPYMNPKTMELTKSIYPVRFDALNAEFFAAKGWNENEIAAWNDILSARPATLITNERSSSNESNATTGIFVPPSKNNRISTVSKVEA